MLCVIHGASAGWFALLRPGRVVWATWVCLCYEARGTHTTHTHKGIQPTQQAVMKINRFTLQTAGGVRGVARANICIRPLCDTVMLKWETCTLQTQTLRTRHTRRIYECVQKAVCFNLRWRRRCKNLLFLGTWIKHLVHRPLFSASFFYCRNALLNCIFITLRADFNANVETGSEQTAVKRRHMHFPTKWEFEWCGAFPLHFNGCGAPSLCGKQSVMSTWTMTTIAVKSFNNFKML
jgi:hypothetical protein